nr:integrase, catalytic region, zinc finger, CCHC-type, peptidase aspartic, catalytic [Tanacetum cinerariifolium]
GVQIPENNLDNLHSLREEDGILETVDPQDLLGCDLLALVDGFTPVEDNVSLLETSDSILLTPLCCDDIHNVTPRASALAGCDILGVSGLSFCVGTVKFGIDHVAKIMGYGDYEIENVTISRVYYVEELGHNLFSVGQFGDSNLEVAFRQL